MDPKTANFAFNKIYLNQLQSVGFGRIGKELKYIAKNFGDQLLFYKKNKIKLADIARKSDIISISLSLNNKNKNMINKNFFLNENWLIFY